MQLGTLVRFDVSPGFGFIEPDLDSEASSDEESDYDGYNSDDGRHADNVFVHLSVLRAAAKGGNSRGYPQPQQRLVFRAERGRQGMRASIVADAEDGSFLALPLSFRLSSEQEASVMW